jgi:hypothetical protein
MDQMDVERVLVLNSFRLFRCSDALIGHENTAQPLRPSLFWSGNCTYRVT